MRKSRAIVLLLVSVLSGTVNASAQLPEMAVVSREKLTQIDRVFGEAMESRALPGASVTIAFGDGRSITRNYGTASLTTGLAVTPQTRFRIGSISKTFTALAILKLVEEGRLTLDAPISLLLPDLGRIGRLPDSITVKHLLNHTSGLPDYTPAELHAKIARAMVTDTDLVVVLEREAVFEPGSDWAYSDAGYRILSRIVEKASGLTFERYMVERLAPALGLPSLRLCDPKDPGQASGYISQGNRFRPEPAYAIRGLLGEGGLCATTADLGRFPARLNAGKWIAKPSLDRMTSATRLSGGQEIDYGLGMRRGMLGGTPAWGHTGGGPDGSWASFAHYPARNFTVAVMANGTGSGTDAATLQAVVAAILLGNDAPADGKIDPTLARTLAGAYVRDGETTCLDVTNGKLVRRGNSSARALPLLFQGANIFARSDYPNDRFAFQVEDGRVIGYRVYYDGLFTEYWRRAQDDSCRKRG